jgi:hypothetical protein
VTDFLSPPQQPNSRVTLLTRIGATVGALILAGFAASVLFAYGSSVKVDDFQSYTWRSQSAIYLANGGFTARTCTITPPNGDARDFRILRRPSGKAISELSITGVRVDRWFTGDATVSCDNQVTLSSGPVLWLYPLAHDAAIPTVGLVLVVIWWGYGRRGKARRVRSD